MGKRTIVEKPTDAIKEMRAKQRRQTRSTLPDGFIFLIKDDGLYIKNLDTGAETKVAN